MYCYGQQLSKSSISHLFQQKKSKFWSLTRKILGIFLLMSIWIFVTVMDIMFIYEYKKTLIPQEFKNTTMVSCQTSTVDLHFSLMVAHYLMYFIFICKLTFNFWRKSKSKDLIDKILHRSVLFHCLQNEKNFCFRYELNLSQSFLSLPQFCLQLSGVCIIETMLWSNISSELSSDLTRIIFLLSSFGHFLSLATGQYLGLMIQHQNSLSSIQRYGTEFLYHIVYFYL